jgi:long-chain acyl-CoA synthetase
MGIESKYREWRSLPAMFFEQAEKLGDTPFLWRKTDGAFRPWSWAETARQVSGLSRGLRVLGVASGDRVVIVSENRPEWVIADLAVMAAGAISVPAYTTNTVSDHLHILEDSGAKAAIVSTARLAERFLPAATRAANLGAVVTVEPFGSDGGDGVSVLGWDEVLARGEAAPDDVAQTVAALERGATGCFIYTSGTGGAPKGVMLSHGAILCNCLGAYDLLLELGLEDEVFLSFLPLSHSYEHTAGLYFPISIGAQIYYAESIEKLAGNMLEVRPTLMTAVPRLYETMHARITRDIERAGGVKKLLFDKALALGRKKYEAPGSLGPIERLTDSLVERLVREKVRARFGGRLKALISGGAPLNVEIGLFFHALGLRLLQGYGQTESAPVVSCNRPHRVKMHTVGPPFVDVGLRIAEDGEILLSGELVMNGYWNNPEATAEVLKDGWLHTGDIGRLDEDGYLQITDRKKDIIVNSGGDNLSPQRVEGYLSMQPEIGQAMVYGDKRPHLVALIVPDADFLKAWAAEAGRPADLAALRDDPGLRGAVEKAIERVNRELSGIERVRRFVLAEEPFSVENEMMTPTLKIRRHVIREKYRPVLEALY